MTSTESRDNDFLVMLIDKVTEALAIEFSQPMGTNHKYDRKKEEKPGNEREYVRSMEERKQDVCMVSFIAEDGHVSLRTLDFSEVAVVAARTILALITTTE